MVESVRRFGILGSGGDWSENWEGSGYSYPGFLGSFSRTPPPLSLRTSFSLLRRIEARSLLKEPLRFREPEPSCEEKDYGVNHIYAIT